MLLVEEVLKPFKHADRVNMDHVKDLSKVLAEVQQILGNDDDGIEKILHRGC